GRCNLECIMCDVWSGPNGVYDEAGFWDYAPERLFPFLRELHVLGGEPFIQKDTFRLIDAVTRLNPDSIWSFITHAHWRCEGPIEAALERVRLRNITVSIDSLIPETYARIRRKGSLERVLSTLDALVAYRARRLREDRGFGLIMTMVVQQENWRELES